MNSRLKDIAEKLDISLMTVSRAVNNKPGVKQATKEKILKAVEKFNYYPNHVARSLVTKKTYTIGLILPDIMNPFFPAVAKGCQGVAEDKGYHILLCHSGENLHQERAELDALLQMRVDGMLVVTADSDRGEETYKHLKRTGIPFVLLDRYWRGIDCSYVGCSDLWGAEEAVNYLVKLGHQRIAHIAGPQKLTTAENRLKGYKNALRKHDIPFDRNLVLEGGLEKGSGYAPAEEILNMEDRPTAIFTFSDELALNVLDAFEAKGVKVPEDISVIGFTGLSDLGRLKVPLTTINQPKEEMGSMGMRILLEKMEQDTQKEKKIELKTELIIRHSCSAPKK